jgi:Rieske Fe-S protein
MSSAHASASAEPSRRELASLAGRLLAGGALGLAGLMSWRFASWAPSGRELVVFPAAAVGARAQVRRIDDVILVESGDRAWALSARCTHLGCAVVVADDNASLACPCHGSRYGLDGTVLQGPATAPLPPLSHTRAEDGSHVVERG